MRYLYTVDSDQLFAYAPGRRDFFTAGDDRLWAHESHGWLIAAESGETLAHRTGDVYYGAIDGEPLYRVTTDRKPEPASADASESDTSESDASESDTDESDTSGADASGADESLGARRATHRAARARL